MLLKIEDISNEQVDKFLNTLPITSKHIFNLLFLNTAKDFSGTYSINKHKIQRLKLIKPNELPNLVTEIVFPNSWEIKYGTLKTACRIFTSQGILEGVYLKNCSNQTYKFYKNNKKYCLENIN